MAKRNSLIDFLKLFMIFLVVCIHYSTFVPREIIVPFARIAIPLFFMFSGYFVALRNKTDTESAKQNIVSALKYLLFGFSVFILYTLIDAIIDGNLLNTVNKLFYDNFLRDFVFYNVPSFTGIHLWFLVALFITALIHYAFCKTEKTKLYPFIAAILLIAALCFGQYSKILGLEHLPNKFTRNAVFTGFPFFAIGFFFGKNKPNLRTSLKYILLALGCIFALLQPIENFLLNEIGYGYGRLYISTYLSSIPIFIFVITTPLSCNTKWLPAKLVFYIYIFHKLIGDLLYIPYNFKAIAVFIITFVLCECICFSKYFFSRFRRRKLDEASVTT